MHGGVRGRLISPYSILVMLVYYSAFLPERMRFVMIPSISAHAIDVMVTLPKVSVRPPIPVIRITLTTKRFLFSSRLIFLNILRPLTAIKPYSATQTPPITQLGMELTMAINGDRKEMSIAIIAAVMIVTTEAFEVIATHPTDSPYVVFGQPPKNAPTTDPIPSPRSVL